MGALWGEEAVTVAQQHAHTVVAEVGGEEVGPAVAVDVRHRHRFGTETNSKPGEARTRFARQKPLPYRPAAAFYADAFRLSRPDPGMMMAPAIFPLTLPHGGKLDEAWEYVRHQLDLIPNAVSYAVASLLCFSRAQREEGAARNRLYEEQSAFLELARADYDRLPESHRQSEEIRALMSLVFETAALDRSKSSGAVALFVSEREIRLAESLRACKQFQGAFLTAGEPLGDGAATSS